jgi:hypothetical protein
MTGDGPPLIHTPQCFLWRTTLSIPANPEGPDSHVEATRWLAELPQEDAGGNGADNGATVADEQDQFLEVLEL